MAVRSRMTSTPQRPSRVRPAGFCCNGRLSKDPSGAASKIFRIRENKALRPRADAINLPNQPPWGAASPAARGINTNINAATFKKFVETRPKAFVNGRQNDFSSKSRRSHQNTYLRANCMILGLLSVWILPKTLLLKAPVGLLKFTRF